MLGLVVYFLVQVAALDAAPRILHDINSVVRHEGETGWLDCTVEGLEEDQQIVWMKQDVLQEGGRFALSKMLPEGFTLVSMGPLVLEGEAEVKVIQTDVPGRITYRFYVKSLTKEYSADYRCMIQTPFKDWDKSPYKDGFITVIPKDQRKRYGKYGEFAAPMSSIEAKAGEKVTFNCSVKNAKSNLIWFMKVKEVSQGYDQILLLSLNSSDEMKHWLKGPPDYSISLEDYEVNGEPHASVLYTINAVEPKHEGTYRCMLFFNKLGTRLSRHPHTDGALTIVT